MADVKKTKKLTVKHLEVADSKGQIGHNSRVVDLVQTAHETLNEMGEREFSTDLFSTLKTINHESLEGGYFVHLTQYMPNAKASIVPRSKAGVDTADLAEKAPPKDGDYLDHDCFVYFFGDHALILSNRVSEVKVSEYFTQLLRKSNVIDDDQIVRLSDVAEVGFVEKIRKYGVKSIRLKTRIDPATWLASAPEATSFKDRMSSALKMALQNDPNVSPEQLKNYEYELAITNKGTLEAVERDPLNSPAIQLYQDCDQEHDECEIVLNDNQGHYTANALKLSKEIKLNIKGKSLDIDRVKKECVEYKRELLREGTLNE